MYIFCDLQDNVASYEHPRLTDEDYHKWIKDCFHDPVLKITVPLHLGNGSYRRRSRSQLSPNPTQPAATPDRVVECGQWLAHLHTTHDLSPNEINRLGRCLETNRFISETFYNLPNHDWRVTFIRNLNQDPYEH